MVKRTCIGLVVSSIAIAITLGSCLMSTAQLGTNPLKLLDAPSAAGTRLSYGAGSLQFGELRLPAGKGPFPLVILIHGGCWKRQLEPGVPEAVTSYQLLSPAATSLTAHGFATWNIEYRRLGDDGAGWPGTYLDIAAATDFVRSISAQKRLDLGRVAVLGHSSGGQLALWDAGRHKLPKTSPLYVARPLPIEEAISIDGPADLRSLVPLQQTMCGGPVVTELLGGTPEQEPERYIQGAVTGLSPIGVPQFVLSRAQPEVLLKLAQDYATAARKNGDAVRVVVQQGSSHFDGINPATTDWETVVTELKVRLKPHD
jgi:acetyl esterase/lipase